jgi:hypothetical protein
MSRDGITSILANKNKVPGVQEDCNGVCEEESRMGKV